MKRFFVRTPNSLITIDLALHWTNISKGTFLHVAAHILMNSEKSMILCRMHRLV